VTLVDASILRLAGASDELPAMVAQELTVTVTHVTKRRATAGKGRAPPRHYLVIGSPARTGEIELRIKRLKTE
jgi:hypothetical protein